MEALWNKTDAGKNNEQGFGTLGEDLISYGANKVTLFQDKLCLPYQADTWLPDITAVAKESKASLILMGHNSTGGDLAPRVAFQLKCGVATSCEKITIEGALNHIPFIANAESGN